MSHYLYFLYSNQSECWLEHGANLIGFGICPETDGAARCVWVGPGGVVGVCVYSLAPSSLELLLCSAAGPLGAKQDCPTHHDASDHAAHGLTPPKL